MNYYLRDNDEESYSYTQTEEYHVGPCCEMIPLIAFDPMESLSFSSLKQNGLKSRLMGAQTISPELVSYLESVEDNMGNSELYQRYAETLPLGKLRMQAQKQSRAAVKVSQVTVRQFSRNVCVSQYAKVRGNGICQLCGKSAPFKDGKGNPYIESHHVVWLSRGGPDAIDNVVALCPNCHKKMHILDLPQDVQKLLAEAKGDT